MTRDMTHTFIEDAQAADAVADLDAVLSDEALADGGLVPLRAYVRTKASANALRSRKARERAEKGESGPPRKPLSIQAPPTDEARQALKDAAKAMVDGRLDPAALTASIEGRGDRRVRQLGQRVAALLDAGGPRAWLLRRWLGQVGDHVPLGDAPPQAAPGGRTGG